MALRKRDDTVNLKSKHQIALSRELALEEAIDLSSDYGMNDVPPRDRQERVG